MKKVIAILELALINAPKIKYYAGLVIHAVDMLDGVQDWGKENKPVEKNTKAKK
ncbi:hypothetical protein [Kaistella sp.]|uniref:hypothetical protein n=1 Tax=Kaistella sp. TaxID=2782235 RepID=UPI003C44BA82